MSLLTRRRDRKKANDLLDKADAPRPLPPPVENTTPNSVAKLGATVEIHTRYDLGLISELQQEAVWDEAFCEWEIKKFVTCWDGTVRQIDFIEWQHGFVLAMDANGKRIRIEIEDTTAENHRYVDGRLVQTVVTRGRAADFRQKVIAVLDQTHP